MLNCANASVVSYVIKFNWIFIVLNQMISLQIRYLKQHRSSIWHLPKYLISQLSNEQIKQERTNSAQFLFSIFLQTQLKASGPKSFLIHKPT